MFNSRYAVKASQEMPAAGSGLICSWRPLAYAVIPARAGIQSLDNALPEACGVDSRFRGNDGVVSTLSKRGRQLSLEKVACSQVQDAFKPRIQHGLKGLLAQA